jgi:hypothetical protein
VIRENSIAPFVTVDSRNQESVDFKDNDDKDYELHPQGMVNDQRYFHGCVYSQGIRSTIFM